jgi:hypothetical protein
MRCRRLPIDDKAERGESGVMTFFGRIRITWEHLRVCWGPIDLVVMDVGWPPQISRMWCAGQRVYEVAWGSMSLWWFTQWREWNPGKAARSAAKEK